MEEGRLYEQLQVWRQQGRVWTTITDTKRHNQGSTSICALVEMAWDKLGDTGSTWIWEKIFLAPVCTYTLVCDCHYYLVRWLLQAIVSITELKFFLSLITFVQIVNHCKEKKLLLFSLLSYFPNSLLSMRYYFIDLFCRHYNFCVLFPRSVSSAPRGVFTHGAFQVSSIVFTSNNFW